MTPPLTSPHPAYAPWRQRLKNWIESSFFQNLIMALIIINAIILGLETSADVVAATGHWLRTVDSVLLAVFVVEIVARLLVHRLAFFRDPWSVFDFSIVAIALIPASGPLAVLRALRVLRVLRLLTIVPSMRRVVGALLAAIPGLVAIAGVLMIIFYVFAVIATKLFGETFPDWFGNLGASLYTLFQVMTLESWSMGIARPVMESFPYAWAFFVPFILVATFTMLNLFIAIIVNAMQTFNDSQPEALAAAEAASAAAAAPEALMRAELRTLRQDIAELKALLQNNAGAPGPTGA